MHHSLGRGFSVEEVTMVVIKVWWLFGLSSRASKVEDSGGGRLMMTSWVGGGEGEATL